jgi:hypothetical protein
MSDTRSRDLKHLKIDPVEFSRVRINTAGADMREVRVTLSRVKFGEVRVDAVAAKTAPSSTERPRLKPGADPQRNSVSKRPHRTSKSKWD